MKLKRAIIQNFRILEDVEFLFSDTVTWLVGKNNVGKTSFGVALEKFLGNRAARYFNYNDFPMQLRPLAKNHNNGRIDFSAASIRLLLEIEYTSDDSLENLSSFMNDLDENVKTVKIGLEATIDSEKVIYRMRDDGISLEDTEEAKKQQEEFLEKNLTEPFIKRQQYLYSDETDFLPENREKLIQLKEDKLSKIIHFESIQADRNLSSSEARETRKNKQLASVVSEYFNSRKNDISGLNDINKLIRETDKELDEKYSKFFESLMKDANDFIGPLEAGKISIESDLESSSLITYSSKVVYGSRGNSLPENLNGLGYLNILFLLLDIELKLFKFEQAESDMKILFIEEPEAHTHPQLQRIFAEKIGDKIARTKNLQALISTHSPYIVSKCDFQAIEHFRTERITDAFTIKIINVAKEMRKQMQNDEKKYAEFVQKYFSIESAELFFADKAICIEGLSESILINYFMKCHDDANMSEQEKLLNQNISILQVGANAKAFVEFFKSLALKCLVITDIDSVSGTQNKSCAVKDGTSTSNATIKALLGKKGSEIIDKLKNGETEFLDINPFLRITTQTKVGEYHARTFEDAFIAENLDNICQADWNFGALRSNALNFQSLRNELENGDFYNAVFGERGLLKGRKSDFAADIYRLSISEESVEWNVPHYIKKGLEWLAESVQKP